MAKRRARKLSSRKTALVPPSADYSHPRHTAQCPRTRTLSWCFFAAMFMTSVWHLRASSLSHPCRALRANGAQGRGALLEAQHLVKGPQELKVASSSFLLWRRRGPCGVGPHGREGGGREPASSPQLGPGASLGSRAESS